MARNFIGNCMLTTYIHAHINRQEYMNKPTQDCNGYRSTGKTRTSIWRGFSTPRSLWRKMRKQVKYNVRQRGWHMNGQTTLVPQNGKKLWATICLLRHPLTSDYLQEQTSDWFPAPLRNVNVSEIHSIDWKACVSAFRTSRSDCNNYHQMKMMNSLPLL